MKYQTKPEFVEATQFKMGSWEELDKLLGAHKWMLGDVPGNGDAKCLILQSARAGEKTAHPGDWIISLGHGAFRVMNDDEFRNKYIVSPQQQKGGAE